MKRGWRDCFTFWGIVDNQREIYIGTWLRPSEFGFRNLLVGFNCDFSYVRFRVSSVQPTVDGPFPTRSRQLGADSCANFNTLQRVSSANFNTRHRHSGLPRKEINRKQSPGIRLFLLLVVVVVVVCSTSVFEKNRPLEIKFVITFGYGNWCFKCLLATQQKTFWTHILLLSKISGKNGRRTF